MAAEYQTPDWRVVDYQPYCLDEAIMDRTTQRPLWVRGPRPERLEPGEYFVCLGAAQTFGRFCERPFPTILQDRLGLPVLNISHGGAGPAFFCNNNERLIKYLNDARFVVVQVMSGRSDSNSLFESEGVGYFRRRSDGQFIRADQAFSELLQTRSRAVVMQIVEETRQSWLSSYRQLLEKIRSRKILFWFATRTPGYQQGWKDLDALFGPFPQLVNAAMVADLRRECDHYVECVSRRGLPQLLVDRFTGLPTTVTDPWAAKPWTRNWYYPSPEMHEAAARALEPTCRSLGNPQPARVVARHFWSRIRSAARPEQRLIPQPVSAEACSA
jgi:hypothetical protein